jgi:nucleotide-binding universal stress UspA family protein
MNDIETSSSILVGIDGSDAAVGAALWSIDEAVSRNIPMRLVYVMKATHPSRDAYDRDLHHAKASLHAAQAAVEAAEKTVKIETAILDGPPGAAILAEADDAALICVGTVGTGRFARSILGSTATELAEKASCPVAVIRPQPESPASFNWVVVGANDQRDNDVVDAAMREAELRQAPVLLVSKRHTLDRQLAAWRSRYPDVHIYPITHEPDLARFLKKHGERVQLVVIGDWEANHLPQILGPYGNPVSSALILRH